MASVQPKKPQTAFFLYIEELRPAIVKQLGERSKEKGLVIKTASEQWKGLAASAKAPYESKAAKLKAEYDKALEAFKAGGGEVVRKRKGDKNGKPKKDKNAPKKPSGGGYGIYLAENRAEIVKSLPAGSNPISDVAKAAGAQWKALTDAQRKPYESKFSEKMVIYKAAMEDYKASKPEDNEEEAEDEEEDEEEETEEVEKPAAKKAKTGNDDDVMAEVKKQGYSRQFKLLTDNPKLAATPANKVLEALRTSNGAVVGARKALLGA